MPDAATNEILGAMALVCGIDLATYVGADGYTLEAIDPETGEQFTVTADNLMNATCELGWLLGVDWEDI